MMQVFFSLPIASSFAASISPVQARPTSAALESLADIYWLTVN